MTMRHEAIFYHGAGEYADAVGGRVTAALDAGQPVLVAVPEERADLLRDVIGERPGAVEYLDMDSVGRNPARIIPMVAEFIDHCAGRPSTGIGEPAWPDRSEAETAEVVRHEALVNTAFAGTTSDLLCPYDAAALQADALEAAARTHPVVNIEGQARESATFTDPAEVWSSTRHLPAAPPGAPTLEFDRGRLAAVRDLVVELAGEHLPAARARHLVIAANEVASNSVQHAGGTGTVRVWAEPDAVVCEIRDAGRLTDQLAGRRAPEPAHGRGLWLANQLCDLVQLHPDGAGTVVRMRVGFTPGS